MEYRIQGKQPDHHYAANKCKVSENQDGKSYIWAWNNEIITINLVGISYRPTLQVVLFLIIFTIIVIVGGIIGITFFIIKKTSTRKKES